MEIPKIPTQQKRDTSPAKKVVKVTAKKKKVVVLPEFQTYIIQPNRVTYSIFDGFSLLQLKAFTAIMLNLQEAIKFDMNNGDFKQLSLFDRFDQAVRFDLSLRDITKDPTAYTDVKEAISQISEINVKIPLKDEKGRVYHISSSLVTALIPEKADYKSVVGIKIERAIAEYLIMIPKGKQGLAQEYTRYMLEVALNAGSIHTIKIYQLISSWKSKGGFKMSYNEFRDLLAIPTTAYPRWYDFKKYVLMPAQEGLTEKADCWFNCEMANFRTHERNSAGKKEYYLNFKVITPEFQETMKKQRANIINLLSIHFSFKDSDLQKISPILDNENIATEIITMKIIKISQKIDDSLKTGKPVKDKRAYALQSLLTHEWLPK